jgi:DNA-binding winged helix-turn-helix (wHTH) protein
MVVERQPLLFKLYAQRYCTENSVTVSLSLVKKFLLEDDLLPEVGR